MTAAVFAEGEVLHGVRSDGDEALVREVAARWHRRVVGRRHAP